MKHLFFAVCLVILMCSNKKVDPYPIPNTQTYSLKGNVELLIEKRQLIHLDADLNYTVDTIKYNGLTKYYYFNRLLELDSMLIAKPDTLFFGKVFYYKTLNSDRIYSSNFSMKGKKELDSKMIRFKNNIVFCNNFAPTLGLHSKTEEKWENSKIVWSKWESTLSSSYQEQIFEFDANGFETLIKSRLHKKDDFTIYKVAYLEWDALGNWTKRIDYNESDLTGSVVSRQIKYRK